MNSIEEKLKKDLDDEFRRCCGRIVDDLKSSVSGLCKRFNLSSGYVNIIVRYILDDTNGGRITNGGYTGANNIVSDIPDHLMNPMLESRICEFVNTVKRCHQRESDDE